MPRARRRKEAAWHFISLTAVRRERNKTPAQFCSVNKKAKTKKKNPERKTQKGKPKKRNRKRKTQKGKTSFKFSSAAFFFHEQCTQVHTSVAISTYTVVSEIKRPQGIFFASKKVFSSLSLERFSINRCFPHFFSRVPCSFSKRLEFLSTFGHHA